MNTIPEILKENFEKDGFHIVANDKPCLSVISLLDEKIEDNKNTLLTKSSMLKPDWRLFQVGKKSFRRPTEKGEDPSASRDDYSLDTVVKSLVWHMERINRYIIGREEIIKQAIYAILTGEHILLLSRTGMAKSYLVNSVFNIFDGARVFSSQASKDQTPDNYFGPYNIEEFRKGKIRHNIKGSVIEANLIFLDEFFDASDVVLRSLLTVLNERKFINGQEQIDAAVHTAVATANYMRANEVTEAILDRFTYKSIIPEDMNTYNQLRIDRSYEELHGRNVNPVRKLYFDEILFVHNIIMGRDPSKKIEISDLIYFLKNVLINKYMTEMRDAESTFFISPRKQAKLADQLRASAILHNRDKVNMDDLKEMSLGLCTLNKHITLKSTTKTEIEVFLDVYQRTMTHFKSTGALEQIEFLLQVRRVFEELKNNPQKREQILSSRGPLAGLLDMLKRVFPGRSKKADDEISITGIKQSISAMNPTVEEVHDLKNGILKEYHDLI